MTFINHGIEKFKMENPFVIFKRFNIEKIDIDNNDLDINGFDIIICSNVIHATKNIRNVLSSLKSLLKEQGSLYLNELISNPTYITLTFGLSYGWWHYEDTESRIPCSPLLKLEKWLELLRESGFSDITTHGSEDILTPDVKQAIIEAS
jgi:ubiquinone/menaquinone biosynthesis C-methylase UbiE